MDNFVVTFARGFGTGGKAIASQLAKELGMRLRMFLKAIRDK